MTDQFNNGNTPSNLRRRTLLGLAMAATALAFTNTAIAQSNYKAEYKMSLVLGPPTPWGMAGQIWADLVKERTQGRINIKLYPGVSLVQGDQTREFSALRQGVIDMAVGSTINWSPQVKELNLFSLPFLMPDYAAVDALTSALSIGSPLVVLTKRAPTTRGIRSGRSSGIAVIVIPPTEWPAMTSGPSGA